MDQQEVLNKLLMDDTFRQWVWSAGEEHNLFWNQWQVNHPEYQQEVEEARQIILELKDEKSAMPKARKDLLRQKVIQMAHSEKVMSERKERQENVRWLMQDWAKIAAAITVLLLAAFWLYVDDQSQAAYIRYATNYGEVKTFVLPDSSVVTLNSNSAIKYAHQINENQAREAWLQGEAFFEIQKKNIKEETGNTRLVKFIVHTNNLAVQVLGTKFNIWHRRGQTQVMLEEGSVALNLEKQKAPVLMEPNELVEVNQEGKQVSQKTVESAEYVGWKSGLIQVSGASFQEIKTILQDNYDLRLEFEDQELAREINLRGSFPSDNINILLEAIANITQTTIIKKGNTIIYH